MQQKFLTRSLGAITLVVLLGSFMSGAAWARGESFILQSTTSTSNSGLYDYLLPKFKEKTGITVNVVAVGTGQAIRNAKNGDGDVLLVHARSVEEQFVADGFGVERFNVMYNDFVIVGPPSDPAGLRQANSVADALKRIASTGSLFASRGDDSGTHKKELALWQDTDINPDQYSGKWYRATGSGMGATLNAAVGMGAYTMTDRGTWISFKNKSDFQILFEDHPPLFNQYGVILVNPQRHPNVKAESGQKFIDWILSDQGQAAIAEYKLEGQQLFFPNAEK